MSRSNELSTAKKDKKDEFYTTLEDIELEMKNYREQFKGKIIFCNCDDPYESNFFKYFAMNFNFLGLKKLIATCYDGSPFAGTQLSLFDLDNSQTEQKSKTAYKVEVTNIDDLNGDGAIDLQDVELLLKKPGIVKKLNGNGDFRSEECIDLLKESDIVITNPPFSLFREFVALLIQYNKKFLIIGNVNAITYKEIFPLIKNNKLWLGASIHSGDRKFYVPDDYPLNAAGCGTDKDGRRYIRVKGVRWFTNLDYKQRHEDLILYKKYYGHEEDYPKYDNYDAINVDSTADIPCDYFEKIGVPITALDKYNPDQFEIVKFRKGDDGKDLAYTREREREYSRTSESSSRENDCNGLMGVPITFLDKYNPDQFDIIGYTAKDMGIECTKFYEDLEQSLDGGPFVRNMKSARFSPMIRTDEKPIGNCYRASNVSGFLQKMYGRIVIKRKKAI